jgi:hypothetical protein
MSKQDPYGRLMRPLFHPAIEDVRPEAILHALDGGVEPADGAGPDRRVARMSKLEGKVAVVTGASKGIGAGMATEFKTPTDG